MESTDEPNERHDDIPRDDASVELVSESGDSNIRELEWSIAGSDVGSMDFQKLSIHSKMAKIVHHDGRQFIERRDLEDGGLPYSAEFYLGDEVWKLNGEDCLLLSHRRYIAKVSVDGTVDLEGAADFAEAVRLLLMNVKVLKVLLDEQLEECSKAKSVLECILDKVVGASGNNIDHKRDVMLLRILIQKNGNSLNMSFMDDLRNCSGLSREIVSAIDKYVTTSLKLIQRNEILGQSKDSSLSDEFINEALQKALFNHKAQLAAICPSTLIDKLKELPDDQALYLSTDDINLFNDLMILDQAMFEKVLPQIFSKFVAKVQKSNAEQHADLDPLSNRIYVYVYKSLRELSGQLDREIIYSEDHGWKVANVQEDPQNLYSKCLHQQVQMLARLANHFEPGGAFRASRFPYAFKLFQNMEVVPESVRIWMCLLDDGMKDLVHADIDNMQMLSCFFKSYVSFIASEEFHCETLECLRTITHDALRTLTEIKSSFKHDQTTLDSALLEYNEMISCCLNKFLVKHFANDCEQIQATLRRIIGQAMIGNVATEESKEFSYVFKQLLKDLSDLPMEWYLRLPPSEIRNLLLRRQFIALEDNRWKDTERECLKVVDPEGFVKMYQLLYNGKEIPKHYHLKAIRALLDKIAAKQSSYDGKFRPNKNQLSAMTSMINSIRSSILFLNRQPDYSCFEDFLKEIGESFSHTIEEMNLENDGNQMSVTNNSAETDSTHEEIQDPLPDLFEGSISKELLINSLKLYTTQFDKHMKETVQLPREKRIARIVSDVKHKVKPQLATSWTEEFKRNELPKVLGSLSAVWSLLVTKNGSSSEKLIKLSNLQISCVLSFFGDQNHNDDNLQKLLYISTQQGKQLVVGLTAALLALHGHKVLIACYNSNLTRRNSTHLIEFFRIFVIENDISYGSMEDMAREGSRKDYEKYAADICKRVGLIKANNDNQPSNGFQCERSVLLIEDIDLLLLYKTLGQAFHRYVRPTIPGLAQVQEKFLTQKENFTVKQVDQFIEQSKDPELCKLKAFLNRSQSFSVLRQERDGQTEFQEYTNKSLLDAHLRALARTKYCYTELNGSWISGNGVMMLKNTEFSHCDRDVLYFTLRKSGFQQIVNGYKNYGFLTIGYIPFPYVHLRNRYPLVFGFAEAPLDSYEEICILVNYDIYYNIAKSNPSLTSSVKFDPKKDFLCIEQSSDWSWMYAVLSAINTAIDRNCSVLVFFKSGLEMEKFQREFALPLKQLSVTAIETASNREHSAEDEIAMDEVTVLVIERNGELVEDREVHVIQTFFSDDVKEENLIRRQAERSHGCGSYELIVPRHIYEDEDEDEENTDYDLLVKSTRTKTLADALTYLIANIQRYENIEQFVCNECM